MATYLEFYATKWGRRVRKISAGAAAALHKLGGRVYTSIPALGYSAPQVAAPTVTSAPVLADTNGGLVAVGDVLTVTPGVFTGSPTVTRVWKRGAATISGATGTTYTLVSGDAASSITVVETATNAGGSISSTSNAIAVP